MRMFSSDLRTLVRPRRVMRGLEVTAIVTTPGRLFRYSRDARSSLRSDAQFRRLCLRWHWRRLLIPSLDSGKPDIDGAAADLKRLIEAAHPPDLLTKLEDLV